MISYIAVLFRAWVERITNWIYSSSVRSFLSGFFLIALYIVIRDFVIREQDVISNSSTWLFVLISGILGGIAMLWYQRRRNNLLAHSQDHIKTPPERR
jgi:hypothetical protein